MTLRRVALHLAVWLLVFAAWFFATRQFHPMLPLALSATAILVLTSAAAVYALVPIRPPFARWLLRTAVTVLALDLAAVLWIQFIYDWLWGPDPNRFGFWFNLGSDGFIIALHVAVALLLKKLAARVSSR